MPILNVDLLYDYSEEKKKKLIQNLTKTTHDLLHTPAEKIIVVVNEHKKSDWGRAGITPEHENFDSLSRRKELD